MGGKTLYRSNKNRFITGVCGGIAEYFGWDPSIVRIAVVILSCFSGVGLIAYIVAALVMPLEPDDKGPDVVDL